MATKYKFKGYTIECCGYHQPDHCVWWEAVDDNGCVCFHATTLREVEFMILENEWEGKIRYKEREIAELRECLEEAVGYFCGNDKPADCIEKVYGNPKCETEGQHCMVERWRKALEGASND